MKNEELKKEAVATELDNLTDEQLEAVLGGFVIGGKTYTTSVSVKDLTFEELTGKTFYCGNENMKAGDVLTFGTGKTLGVDAAGSSVYTVDN